MPLYNPSPIRLLKLQNGGADESTGLVAATINTTETAFADTYVIPANYFTAGKALIVEAYGQMTTSVTPVTVTLSLRTQKAGPTNVYLYQSQPVTPQASMTKIGWGMRWLIQAVSAGASVNIECGVLEPMPVSNVQAVNNNQAQPQAAFDTTAQQTLQLTVTFNGNTAGNTVFLNQLLVMAIN